CSCRSFKRGSYSGATEGGTLRDISGSPARAQLSEQEIQVRLSTVAIGIRMTVIVSVGSITYALATWDEPHRELILAVSVMGLLSAPALKALPLERGVRSDRWREPFFVAWSVADVLIIVASSAFDGGTQSPYTLFLVLPFLFAALSYPLRGTLIVGAVI